MKFKFYSKYKLKYFKPYIYPVIDIENKKFIFIHINKNAGSSIINAFDKRKLHLTTKELISLLGEKEFSNAIKFAVVRNPYDRLISQYAHRVKTNQSNMFNDKVDIDTWVRKVYGINKDPKYFTPQYKMYYTQKQWLTDDAGKLRTQHILKFEDLESQLREFCNAYNLSIGLPHLNSSKEYKINIDSFNKESIKTIQNYFEEDFISFGYNF